LVGWLVGLILANNKTGFALGQYSVTSHATAWTTLERHFSTLHFRPRMTDHLFLTKLEYVEHVGVARPHPGHNGIDSGQHVTSALILFENGESSPAAGC
jgi:hypothetical protein